MTEVEQAIVEMFNMKGCDCVKPRRFPAPYHASDCPVYERYLPFEYRLRREAARLRRQV